MNADADDIAGLNLRRVERIERFVSILSDGLLDGEISYVSNEGTSYRKPTRMLLAHLFNHQTHHRGQVHNMLSQAGIATPVLDLPRVISQ